MSGITCFNFSCNGLKPTYKELKLYRSDPTVRAGVGLKPTYKELKLHWTIDDENILRQFEAYL
jgi:hypothetical protein